MYQAINSVLIVSFSFKAFQLTRYSHVDCRIFPNNPIDAGQVEEESSYFKNQLLRGQDTRNSTPCCETTGNKRNLHQLRNFNIFFHFSVVREDLVVEEALLG